MNFERLYYLRTRHDLTQQQMGNIVNVKKYSICNWETGREIIPLSKLNLYSNYFDVSMDYLLGLSNNKGFSNKTILNKNIIGNNIKYIRKINNLTQRDLAKILNTTHSAISAYENGKSLIITAFAYQLCKKFNISLDSLCSKEEILIQKTTLY